MILSILTTVFWFLLIITIIVFLHEMGHLLAARACGVQVEEFSIGFGKELFSRKCKQGTKWKICAIPLGGYVRFYGDATVFSSEDKNKLDAMDANQRKRSFHFKPTWQKFIVVFAGPLANYLTAFIIFTAMFTAFGKYTMLPQVKEIIADSPAASAGFEEGDLILNANGTTIKSMKDLRAFIMINQEKPIEFLVERETGEQIQITVIPQIEELEYGEGIVEKVPIIGIAANSQAVEFRQLNIFSASIEAIKECYFMTIQMLKILGQIIIGDRSLTQLGGPITVAKYSHHSAKMGFYSVVMFIALISINIGLVNLFPIPIVDGGHLVIYAIKMVTGRDLPERVTKFLYLLGGVFLLLLMSFVIINDILKLI